MSDFIKPVFTLRSLLCEQLRDLYDAETRYAALLPEMASKATASELKEELQAIYGRTRDNVSHLQSLCDALGVDAEGQECEAMKGLVREAKDQASVWGDSATQDASLIASAQRIVHYEIAGFGTAREFCRCLKFGDEADVLSDLLERAFAHDKALTRIATGSWLSPGINQESVHAA